jgi:hypothetical protein
MGQSQSRRWHDIGERNSARKPWSWRKHTIAVPHPNVKRRIGGARKERAPERMPCLEMAGQLRCAGRWDEEVRAIVRGRDNRHIAGHLSMSRGPILCEQQQRSRGKMPFADDINVDVDA